jgi:hypothetical protein
MRSILTLLVVAALTWAPQAHGQARGFPPEVRLITAQAEPEQPAFGEPFDLHVTLRVRPGLTVAVSDTLHEAPDVASLGAGVSTQRAAAGDSLEIQATYRLIAFQHGRVALPSMELTLQPAGASPSTAAAAAQTRTVFLGGVEVPPYAPFDEEDVFLTARPAADVLGGDWSLWLLLAIGVATLAGVGTAGTVAPRLWRGGGATLLARMAGRSPRRKALQELDRIRGLGWHRNGRVDDFYALSTDTLRHYTGRTHGDLPETLTSTELMVRMQERWGPERVQNLSSAIANAERVKFGPYRPDPEAAERDWTAIRDWVRRAPER